MLEMVIVNEGPKTPVYVYLIPSIVCALGALICGLWLWTRALSELRERVGVETRCGKRRLFPMAHLWACHLCHNHLYRW